MNWMIFLRAIFIAVLCLFLGFGLRDFTDFLKSRAFKPLPQPAPVFDFFAEERGSLNSGTMYAAGASLEVALGNKKIIATPKKTALFYCILRTKLDKQSQSRLEQVVRESSNAIDRVEVGPRGFAIEKFQSPGENEMTSEEKRFWRWKPLWEQLKTTLNKERF